MWLLAQTTDPSNGAATQSALVWMGANQDWAGMMTSMGYGFAFATLIWSICAPLGIVVKWLYQFLW